MKLFSLKLLALLIIILPDALPARAAVFYVATDGNDGNSGAQTAPFGTIQKAVDVAEAGDTVKVLAGVYLSQNTAPDRGMIIFRHSGAPGKPITFEAVGEVHVKGDGGVANFSGIFEINGERADAAQIHDIVVRRFHLENSTWFGIRLNKAKNILVENNYTYNTGGAGILALNSQNITVRGNTLEKACISPNKAIDTQEIISLSGVDGFEIDHNHIFNGGIGGGNGGEGIDAKTGSRNGTIHHNIVHDLVRLGIYVDSWDRVVENIGIYGNTVYNCAEGIAVSSEDGGTAQAIRIFNNVLYNNQGNGVIISSWLKNGRRQDIEIINNTIFHNGFRLDKKDPWGGGISIESANVGNIVIRNNILSQNNLWQILLNNKAAKIIIDHNLIDNFRGFTSDDYQEEKGKNSINGNPLFTDWRRGDFHLKAKSPAIDRGDSLFAPANDFDLQSRPQAGAVDIGAFEASPAAVIVKSSN